MVMGAPGLDESDGLRSESSATALEEERSGT